MVTFIKIIAFSLYKYNCKEWGGGTKIMDSQLLKINALPKEKRQKKGLCILNLHTKFNFTCGEGGVKGERRVMLRTNPKRQLFLSGKNSRLFQHFSMKCKKSFIIIFHRKFLTKNFKSKLFILLFIPFDISFYCFLLE